MTRYVELIHLWPLKLLCVYALFELWHDAVEIVRSVYSHNAEAPHDLALHPYRHACVLRNVDGE